MLLITSVAVVECSYSTPLFSHEATMEDCEARILEGWIVGKMEFFDQESQLALIGDLFAHLWDVLPGAMSSQSLDSWARVKVERKHTFCPPLHS